MQQLMVHEVTSTSSAPNAELEYSSEVFPIAFFLLLFLLVVRS
jgi:hypothetical protein